jgi:hypothetical protein
MIYEMRTYRLRPGTTAEFLKLYAERGLQIITRYAQLVGCWQTEAGTLNSVVYLWAYNDLGHRGEQRAKLARDPEWQAFVPQILPFLVHQENAFLQPAAFSPLK